MIVRYIFQHDSHVDMWKCRNIKVVKVNGYFRADFNRHVECLEKGYGKTELEAKYDLCWNANVCSDSLEG